jgi:hypothetical protein
VAEVVRDSGDTFLDRYADTLSPEQRRALSDIAACRTAALGGHIEECGLCGRFLDEADMVRIESAYPLKRHVKLLTVVAETVTKAAVSVAARHAAGGGAPRDPAAAPTMRPACRPSRRRIVRG